jgi:hypothetical protein
VTSRIWKADELIDASVSPRTVDDVMLLVAASTRWQLVGGRVVERRWRPSEALR